MRFTQSFVAISFCICLIFLSGCGSDVASKVTQSLMPNTLSKSPRKIAFDKHAEPRGDHGGEQILPAPPAETLNSTSLIRRHSLTPWYRLSNIRLDQAKDRFFDSYVLIDFSRTGGEATDLSQVTMFVKGPLIRGSEVKFFGIKSPFEESSGTLKVQVGSIGLDTQLRLAGKKLEDILNLEFWLVQSSPQIGLTKRFKVSNSIALGSPGELTYCREWTDYEAKALTNWVRTGSTKSPPPDGTVAPTADTQLVPGMPLMVEKEIDWIPATFVRKDQSSVYVLLPDKMHRLNAFLLESVRYEDGVLKSATANPAQYKLKEIRTLPGSLAIIPDDARPLDAATVIVKGTPVQSETVNSCEWISGVVIDVEMGGKLTVRYTRGTGQESEKLSRDKLIVTLKDFNQLQKPDAAEAFRQNYYKAQNVVRGEIPPGYQPVADDVRLVPGMAVQLPTKQYSGLKNGTIVLVEGTRVTVFVEGFAHSQGTEVAVDRRQLLVERQSLEDLKHPEAVERMAARAKLISRLNVTIPTHLVTIDAQTPIFRGMTLQQYDNFGWEEYLVLAVLKDGKLHLIRQQYSSSTDKEVARDSVLISRKDLDQANQPTAQEEFTQKYKTKLSKMPWRSDYKIDLPLPKNAVKVGISTPLKSGTKVGICIRQRWWNAIVEEVNPDDTVRVSWPDMWRKILRDDIPRENLAIAKSDLQTLERAEKAKANAPPPATPKKD